MGRWSSKVEKAKQFAEEMHRGQTREDKQTPAIVHPAATYQIMLDSPWWFTEDELCAGWLHDCIEDTACTFKMIFGEFGEDVAAIVWLLSKPKGLGDLGRRIYFTSLRRVAPSVIAIKLADTLSNLRDLPPDVLAKDGVTLFKDYYIEKVQREVFPLIDVLRMHGPTWHQYANWIESKMQDAIG